ncbi:YidB family protein [Alcaligenes endophyticus]|uniref:YidB family protein n=2 Tax=Alcaligenes endophyticus TaxID=1929088 RepID=A0ABT8EMG2_9BURK|nr:YidB family protein [Alcaligenes endophyticus]MCX5590980.1 YidB family protein [Alcaligenes endophyticus]MDN4122443.1 YidB family protein [Alcaligenes endophyticus]
MGEVILKFVSNHSWTGKMGLFNSMASALLSGASQAQVQSKLLPAVVQVVNGFPGGLEGLAERFRQGGLAEVLGSWISSGPNLPVQTSQLSAVLGQSILSQLVVKSGLNESVVLEGLQQLLPALIKQSSVGGVLQTDKPLDASSLLASVGQLLGSKLA